MQKAWWKESVVYQVYPRSFNDSNGDGIGDLNGITQKLPYLNELGIDVIWLSPIYQSPNADNGYDISDYRAIATEFGTMEDFDRMLESAHELGLKIMMDLVVNHTSDEHPWFVQSRKSRDNAYRNYYIWRDGKGDQRPNHWGAFFGGPAWQYDEETGQYYLHLFTPKQTDLNWTNEKVRQDVYEMMTWWCEKGIDGFRMDVINLISKDENFPDGKMLASGYTDPGPYTANGPHVHEYLKEMNREVLSKYDLITVGECVRVSIDEARQYASLDGKELNMIFQFDQTYLDEDEHGKWTDKKIRLTELKELLSHWQTELHGTAWNSLYWDNHDQPRIVSRMGSEKEAYREASAKMLGTCLHMMEGTPYIYEGEELGMTNYPFTSMDEVRDVESLNAYEEYTGNGTYTPEEMIRIIRLRGRDTGRTPMQWDDSENAGFTTGTPWINVNPNYKEINAKEQMERPSSVFRYYQKLIALRRQYPIIVYGDYQLLLPDSEEIFAYMRTLGNEKLLVICNFTEQEVPYCPPSEFVCADGEMLISNNERTGLDAQLTLAPYEADVFYKKG